MRLILAVLTALLCSPALGAPCELFQGVWGNDRDDGTRRIVYFDDQSSSSRLNTFFELWKGEELLARMYGVFRSSMGASVDTITIVRRYVPFNEDPDGAQLNDGTTLGSGVVEFLDLDNDEMPDWLIIAALTQAMWNLGSDHVEFYGEVDDKAHAMAGPNAFKFIGCRKGPISLDVAGPTSS